MSPFAPLKPPRFSQGRVLTCTGVATWPPAPCSVTVASPSKPGGSFGTKPYEFKAYIKNSAIATIESELN
jgi:hypothetical protein